MQFLRHLDGYILGLVCDAAFGLDPHAEMLVQSEFDGVVQLVFEHALPLALQRNLRNDMRSFLSR